MRVTAAAGPLVYVGAAGLVVVMLLLGVGCFAVAAEDWGSGRRIVASLERVFGVALLVGAFPAADAVLKEAAR